MLNEVKVTIQSIECQFYNEKIAEMLEYGSKTRKSSNLFYNIYQFKYQITLTWHQ